MSVIRVIALLLILHSTSGHGARPTYSRHSVATANAPAMNIGTPIPQKLSELFGPGAPNLSQRERAQKELSIYLEDPAYQKFMTERLRQAAQNVSDPVERAKLQNFTLSDLVQKWKTDFPKISYFEIALALASLEVGSPSVLGRMEPELCAVARQNSEQNAKIGKISGRANWMARAGSVSAKFKKDGADPRVEESEAETSHFLGSAIMEHAQECVRLWWYDAKFKSSLTRFHTLACQTMTRAPGGQYFCVANYVTLPSAPSSKS